MNLDHIVSNTLPLLPGGTVSKVPSDESLKARAVRIVGALISVNVCILCLLFVIARSYPSLLSAGLLALSFGLRHAVDADHIA